MILEKLIEQRVAFDMEHQEFHLKYRPHRWDEVLGHKAALSSIQNALVKKSARTFLLTGGSGVGKTTIARLIAKEVGCSPSDIIEIDGATNTGIDDMRAVIERLQYKSLSGNARTVILDESHAISKQSFQSMLKVLEEPPTDVYWVLCTTEPDRIPKNIRTRCLQYDLRPVSIDAILALLETVVKKEKLSVKDEILELIIEAAEGSPRQALVFLAECAELKDAASARSLLKTVGESKEAIDLCRMLLSVASGKGVPWNVVAKLIRVVESPPETTRIIVLRYMAAVVLSGSPDKSGPAADILDAFATPFLDREGNAPLARACLQVWVGAKS